MYNSKDSFRGDNNMASEHIVILGSSGMVATDVHLHLVKLGYKVSPLSSKICDISNKKMIPKILSQLKDVDFIVNCAAFTDVDGCEFHAKKAMAINGKALMHIANIVKKQTFP